MTVRFVVSHLGEPQWVEYGYGPDARIPVAGEGVVLDGSDPDIPAGIYQVSHVTHHVGLRGPSLTVVDLRWIYQLPEKP